MRYQKKGKYLELDAEKVNFLVKNQKGKKHSVILENETLEEEFSVTDVHHEASSLTDDVVTDPIPTEVDNAVFAVANPSGVEIDFSNQNDVERDDANTTDVDVNDANSTDVDVNDAISTNEHDTFDTDIWYGLVHTGASQEPLSSAETLNPLTSPTSNDAMMTNTAETRTSKQTKIDHDVNKVKSAVKLLTNSDTNLDHKKELEKAAKMLNDARKPFQFDTQLEELKPKLGECKDLETLVHQLWNNPEAKQIFQQIEMSSTLENFLEIGRANVGGPLKTFPPNVNENIYHEIIKFSLEKSKSTVMFMLNLMVDKNKPVKAHDVIKMSYIISYLAHSVNRENNSFVKSEKISSANCSER